MGPVACLPSFLRNSARPIIVILFVACGGSAQSAEIRARDESEKPKSVFIAHDRWHAAIVINKTDVPATVLPEVRDFPWAELLEFSWGDKDYFPAPDPGIGLALKAAFWSGGSVLHVVGLHGAVRNQYPGAEVLEIDLPEEGFQQLIKFISDTFSRPGPSAPADARAGLLPNARFYSANGKFNILRTCNTWVAEGLSAAGLPISPGYVITAGSLNDQLRPLAVGSNDLLDRR